MRHLTGPAIAAAMALAAPAWGQGGDVLAEAGSIRIEDGYARAASPAARSAAAFLTITNTGDADDRLVAVESDAAQRLELHTTAMEDGIARMQALEDGVAVPAGATVLLERGGDHVMFMGLSEPMEQGDSVEMTLVFETAGEVDVAVPVDLERGQAGADAGMDHDAMDHEDTDHGDMGAGEGH